MLDDLVAIQDAMESMKQERDHWREAYCKAEQECTRFEAEYKRLYQELQELKSK